MDELTKVRISGPGDLVSLVPYLVGFVPHDSLVLVWIEAGRVRLTARMDLAMPHEAMVAQIWRMRDRLPSAEVVVITWGIERARAAVVGERVASVLGSVVLDRVHCDGERWYSLLCEDPDCCPPTGIPVEFDGAAAATAVLAGLGRAETRDAAVAMVGGPVAEDPAVVALVARARRRRAHLVGDARAEVLCDVVRTALAGHGEPAPAVAADLAVLSAGARAAAIMAAMLASREDAHEHVELWSRVVACAPGEVAAGPVAVLGIVAWLAGQGAIATECCERLALLDDDHPLLDPLWSATHDALPPAAWDEVRTAFWEEEACRLGWDGESRGSAAAS